MNERLRLIVAKLHAMHARIRQHSLATLVATKSRALAPTSTDDEAFWADLGRLERDLHGLLHGLHADLRSLEHQRTLTWRIPRDLRYSTRQSIKDREQNVLDVVELAEAVLRDLLAVGGDATRLRAEDWREIGEKVAEGVNKVEADLLTQTIAQLEKGEAFTVSNGQAGLGPGHLGPLLGLLVAVVGHALTRRKKKKTR
jgi:hypothetical protein